VVFAQLSTLWLERKLVRSHADDGPLVLK